MYAVCLYYMHSVLEYNRPRGCKSLAFYDISEPSVRAFEQGQQGYNRDPCDTRHTHACVPVIAATHTPHRPPFHGPASQHAMASTEPPVFGPMGKEGDIDGFAIAAIDWEAGVLSTLEVKLQQRLLLPAEEKAPTEETTATPAETERALLMEELDRLGVEKAQLMEKKLALLRQQSPNSSGAVFVDVSS